MHPSGTSKRVLIILLLLVLAISSTACSVDPDVKVAAINVAEQGAETGAVVAENLSEAAVESVEVAGESVELWHRIVDLIEEFSDD